MNTITTSPFSVDSLENKVLGVCTKHKIISSFEIGWRFEKEHGQKYSIGQIDNALSNLKNYRLVNITGSGFPRRWGPVTHKTQKLKKNVPKQLTERCMQAMDYRRRTQPYGVATSGCFFKNVNGQSVGKMIDDLGLKGYSIGGAEISTVHANFIVNKQNATPEDVRKLVDYIKKKIKKAYNVDIEEEVIFL